jgi:hypothetical protein
VAIGGMWLGWGRRKRGARGSTTATIFLSILKVAIWSANRRTEVAMRVLGHGSSMKNPFFFLILFFALFPLISRGSLYKRK